MVNVIIAGYNLLPFTTDIGYLKEVKIPRIRSGKGVRNDPNRATGLAEGGIVTKPTFALIGEGGESEAVIPLSKLRDMGYGGGSGITVNVTAGVGDPVAIGREVAKVMDVYERRSGRVA